MAKLTILEALDAVKRSERILGHDLSEADAMAVVRMAEQEKARFGVESKVKVSQSEVSLVGDNSGWEHFQQHFIERAQASGLDIKGRNYLEILDYIQQRKKLS
jgi:hypothetical protein